MATTRTRIYYEGDGSTTTFTIPFDYLAKRFVQVVVDDILQKGGLQGDPSAVYYFANSTTIRFNRAPAVGQVIVIKRYTDATDRIVNFKDASVLTAKDLNAAQLQTVHIAEEGRDIIDDALTKNSEGDWDARHRRIVNLANPVDDQDAMPYGLYRNDSGNVIQAAEEAKKAAEEAKKAAAEAAASAESVAEDVSLAENILEEAKDIQQDIAHKFDEVIGVADDILSKADAILQQFEEVSEEIAEAAETVLATKDYIEEIVNNNVVQSGLACARSVWTLEEDLPTGTVIRIPGSPTYIVGRKHLFISYDGIVMSPTFYNEVGDFNTASTQISFNFDLFKNQELMVWVIHLGGGGGSGSEEILQEQITALNKNLTQAQKDITNLTSTTDTLTTNVSDLQEEVEALKSGSSTLEDVEERLTTVEQNVDDINQTLTSLSSGTNTAISELRQTDTELQGEIDNLKAYISGSGSITEDFEERLNTVEQNVTTLSQDVKDTNQALTDLASEASSAITGLQQTDTTLQEEIDSIKDYISGGGIPEDVEERLTTVEQDIGTLSGSVTTLSGSVTTLSQDVEDTNQALNALSSETSAAISELQQTDAELRELIEGIDTGNSFGVIDIGGKAEEKNMLRAETPNDVLAFVAGSNVGIRVGTAQSGNTKCMQIYMNLPTYLSEEVIEGLQTTDTTLQGEIDDIKAYISGSGGGSIPADVEERLTTVEQNVGTLSGRVATLSGSVTTLSGNVTSLSQTVDDVNQAITDLSNVVEVAIATSVDKAPANLKVGGLLFVKEG